MFIAALLFVPSFFFELPYFPLHFTEELSLELRNCTKEVLSIKSLTVEITDFLILACVLLHVTLLHG